MIAVLLASTLLAGPPASDPPRLGQKGPPPAWAETPTRSTWLAYGSYCWTTVCADMIPPARRTDIPLLRARRGEIVRIHLRFAPTSAHVAGVRVRPRKTLAWRTNRSGLLLVEARSAVGSASYVARIRLR